MRPNPAPPVAARRVRRAATAVSVLAAVLTVGVSALPSDVVHAAPPAPMSSSSPAIAAAANEARATLSMAHRTASPAMLRRYVAERTIVATMVANELGLDPAALNDAWVRADQRHEIAVLSALSQLGVPYEYLGDDPYVAFDCSGLTSWAWAQAGAFLTHQSSGQIDAAAPRDRMTAQAGDLVQYPGHVMMYLGTGDAIVHAPNSGDVVNITILDPGRASSVRFGNPVG